MSDIFYPGLGTDLGHAAVTLIVIALGAKTIADVHKWFQKRGVKKGFRAVWEFAEPFNLLFVGFAAFWGGADLIERAMHWIGFGNTNAVALVAIVLSGVAWVCHLSYVDQATSTGAQWF